MSKAPRTLPVELVMQVVYEAQPELFRRDLATYSLVCRQWCAVCQPILFSTITLRSESDLGHLDKLVNDASSGVGRYIKLLGIQPSGGSLTWTREAEAFRTTALPNCQKMKLMCQGPFINSDINRDSQSHTISCPPELLLPCFAPFDSLVLSNEELGNLSELTDLLFSMPKLRSFEARNVRWTQQKGISHTLRFAPRLDHVAFDISGHGPDSLDCEGWLSLIMTDINVPCASIESIDIYPLVGGDELSVIAKQIHVLTHACFRPESSSPWGVGAWDTLHSTMDVSRPVLKLPAEDLPTWGITFRCSRPAVPSIGEYSLTCTFARSGTDAMIHLQEMTLTLPEVTDATHLHKVIAGLQWGELDRSSASLARLDTYRVSLKVRGCDSDTLLRNWDEIEEKLPLLGEFGKIHLHVEDVRETIPKVSEEGASPEPPALEVPIDGPTIVIEQYEEALEVY